LVPVSLHLGQWIKAKNNVLNCAMMTLTAFTT
jgi:hypothetical protein